VSLNIIFIAVILIGAFYLWKTYFRSQTEATTNTALPGSDSVTTHAARVSVTTQTNLDARNTFTLDSSSEDENTPLLPKIEPPMVIISGKFIFY
jgi:hypothetical protein